MKWRNFFPVEPANHYSKRCFTAKVRSSLQRGSNFKAMVRGSENLADSCPGTTRNRICSIFLRQREMGESHALLDRQQGSLVLLSERQQCSLVFSFEKIEEINISKEIWCYLLNRNMSITTDYPSSVLNIVVDRESRKKPGSSERLLNPKIFQAVLQLQ